MASLKDEHERAIRMCISSSMYSLFRPLCLSVCLSVRLSVCLSLTYLLLWTFSVTMLQKANKAEYVTLEYLQSLGDGTYARSLSPILHIGLTELMTAFFVFGKIDSQERAALEAEFHFFHAQEERARAELLRRRKEEELAHQRRLQEQEEAMAREEAEKREKKRLMLEAFMKEQEERRRKEEADALLRQQEVIVIRLRL